MKSIYVIANNENVREELYRADIKKGDKVRSLVLTEDDEDENL